MVIGCAGSSSRSGRRCSSAAPPVSLVTDLTRPADPVGAAQLHPLGPALAVLAGVLLAAAGTLVALGLGARQRLGSRYDAPTRAAAGRAGAAAAAPDQAEVDPADWWKALDAGADPTATDGGGAERSHRRAGDGRITPRVRRHIRRRLP